MDIILTALLGSGIGLPVGALLAWVLLQHRLTKDIEELKGKLGLTAIEHEIRFSRLYERRANLLADVYEQIERVHAALRGWGDVISAYGASEKGVEASRAYRDAAVAARDKLAQVYYPHAIWLGRSLCDELNALIDQMGTLQRMLNLEHHAAVAQVDMHPDKTVEPIARAVGEARKNLEARMRTLLGVPEL
jgi:hypothetical protein